MSVSYIAYTILGIQVTEKDFVTKERVETDICGHNVPEGVAFCPECGTKQTKRIRVHTKEVWLPSVKPYLSVYGGDEEENTGIFLDWVYELEGNTTLGISVLEVLPYCSKSFCVLGFGFKTRYNDSVSTCTLEKLQEKTIELQVALKTMGFSPDREIKLYTYLFCS